MIARSLLTTETQGLKGLKIDFGADVVDRRCLCVQAMSIAKLKVLNRAPTSNSYRPK
jgi:hypothetical protein